MLVVEISEENGFFLLNVEFQKLGVHMANLECQKWGVALAHFAQ